MIRNQLPDLHIRIVIEKEIGHKGESTMHAL